MSIKKQTDSASAPKVGKRNKVKFKKQRSKPVDSLKLKEQRHLKHDRREKLEMIRLNEMELLEETIEY